TPDDIILDVYAYPRLSERENELGRNPIRLTDGVQNGAVYFDLPAGNWRVITLLQTHKGVSDSFISVIDDDSVQILIDEVYEPHYQHLKEYIGNTFVGFFSDEPRYRNQQVASVRWQYGYYDKTVGQRGMGLPYNQEVLSMMEAELKIPARELLAALWYDIKGMTEKVRLAYMNAISILYGKHFSLKIGEWCHQHGLMYMGHVQEDMGVHARTGNGCSHFYRCQWGQDYSGIDVVLHQVLPGFAHLNSYSKDAYYVTDAAFYHYVLCQMGASSAHGNPRMKGRAMGECFAAFGWAEDAPMMKWQADYMLVRGTNYFIPNGYDDMWPDSDCPPQLGVRIDPQLPAYQKLTVYMNKMAHLLAEGTHIANAAVLYHAEQEWTNGKNFVDMSVPCKALLDAQINYDILSIDLLEKATVRNGKLRSGKESFDALFVSYAPYLPDRLLSVLKRFAKAEFPVFFVDGTPGRCAGYGREIPHQEIPKWMRRHGFFDVKIKKQHPLLRFYHTRRKEADIYFFFNESITDTFDSDITFREKGMCAVIDGATDKVSYHNCSKGVLHLTLAPYETRAVIFDKDLSAHQIVPEEVFGEDRVLDLIYEISVSDFDHLDEFRFLKKTDKLYNITARNEHPTFSGRMVYKTVLKNDKNGDYCLDLGKVGQIASVRVNGENRGLRMAPPFWFDISLKEGNNDLEITVSNTLVYHERDPLSPPICIPPSGLLGPVILREKIRS
ncbi:MAG: hypothetical protein IJU25_00240, partial [Lachnospiraceae bacterium]|nr:hypothetical protein [Lachnospiraceae bacterium]